MEIAESDKHQSEGRSRYIYHFDGFELSTSPLRLSRDGEEIDVRAQANRLLELLLARIGDPVTTAEICSHLWPRSNEVDSAGAVRVAMVHLRHALGDSARRPKYVETITGVGYRFIHPVAVEETPLLTVYRSGDSASEPD